MRNTFEPPLNEERVKAGDDSFKINLINQGNQLAGIEEQSQEESRIVILGNGSSAVSGFSSRSFASVRSRSKSGQYSPNKQPIDQMREQFYRLQRITEKNEK